MMAKRLNSKYFVLVLELLSFRSEPNAAQRLGASFPLVHDRRTPRFTNTGLLTIKSSHR